MTATNPKQEATVNDGRCTGQTRSGKPCLRIDLTDTPLGLRCAHHSAALPGQAPKARQTRLRPPVSQLRTPADAATLSSWATLQVLKGRLAPRQAAVVKGLLAEFRQAFRDSGIVTEFEALKRQVAALTAKGAP